MCRSGELGRLLWLRGVYGKSGGVGRSFEKSWRNDPSLSGGGILIDQGIHMLDLFRYFVGDFEEVEGMMSTSFWNIPVEDNAFLNLRGSNGIMAQLHSSATLWKHTFQIDLGLEEGYLSIRGLLSKTGSYGRETLVIGRKPVEGGRGVVGNPPEETIYYDHDPSWHVQVEDFLRCIREDAPVTDSTSLDALRVMQLVERIYEVEKPGRLDAATRHETVRASTPVAQRTVVVEPEIHDDEIRPEVPTGEFRIQLQAEAEVLYGDDSLLNEVACPACGSKASDYLFHLAGAEYRRCRDCGTWFVVSRPSETVLSDWREKSPAMQFWREKVYTASRESRREQVLVPRSRWVRQALDLAGLELSVNGVDLDADSLHVLEEAGLRQTEKPCALLYMDRLDRASEPLADLCQAGQRLSPGGLVLANAWLCSGFDISVLRDRHPALNPLERLNLFTEKGLRAMVERAELEVVEFSTPGVLDLEIVRRVGLVGKEELGSFASVLAGDPDADRDHEFIEFLQKNRLSSYARMVMRKRI